MFTIIKLFEITGLIILPVIIFYILTSIAQYFTRKFVRCQYCLSSNIVWKKDKYKGWAECKDCGRRLYDY